MGILSNRWLLVGVGLEIVLTMALVYVPPLQQFFQLEAMPASLWLLVVPFGPMIFGADELRKWFVRRRPSGAKERICAT